MCKDDVSKREPAPATMREAIVAMMREHQIARDKSLPGDIAIGWDKCFDCIKRDITAALALPDIKYIRDDQCTYCGEAHLCSLVPVCEACERASEPWLRPPRPGIDPAPTVEERADWRTATCAECGYICAYPVECTDDVAHQCRNMFSTHIEPNNAACPAFVRRAQATGEGVQDGQ